MSLPVTLATLALSCPLDGVELATDYRAQPPLRVEATSTLSLEDGGIEIVIGGTPARPRDDAGKNTSQSTRSTTFVDVVGEHEEGRPTRVRRTFEELVLESESVKSGRDRQSEVRSPFEGVTLELGLDGDGEVEAEVVEGDPPIEEDALEGHWLDLELDALLPEGEVEVGDEWVLGPEAIRRALGVELRRTLFPEADESSRRLDGRSAWMFRGEDPVEVFRTTAWEGEATLAEEIVEWKGDPCWLVQLSVETSGRLEPPAERPDLPDLPGLDAPPERTHEVELAGRLLISKSASRPVLLELEGEVAFVTTGSGGALNGKLAEVRQARTGTLAVRVEISELE